MTLPSLPRAAGRPNKVFDCGLLGPADTRISFCWVLLNPLKLGPASSRTQALGQLPSLPKDPTTLIF